MSSDIPGVEIWGRGSGQFILPSGYISPDGKVHNKILLKEMDGFDEEFLDAPDVTVNKRISMVLSSCIKELGSIKDKAIIEAAVSDTLAEGQGLPLTSQDR